MYVLSNLPLSLSRRETPALPCTAVGASEWETPLPLLSRAAAAPEQDAEVDAQEAESDADEEKVAPLASWASAEPDLVKLTAATTPKGNPSWACTA